MSTNIIKLINEHYHEYLDEECFDVVQIKNLCNLYKNKNNDNGDINLSDVEFSTPEFKKANEKKKNQKNILKSKEFVKKYSFFIKTIYVCLKMEVELFDLKKQVITLKNNYLLLKALENRKKNYINEHQKKLKYQHKNITHQISPDYESYIHSYITKIKIIDRIYNDINKLINAGVITGVDNLLTLLLPYFYKKIEFIEEYY